MRHERKLKRKTCDIKRSFPTLEEAEEHAFHESRRLKGAIQAYHCPYCKKYHIGHKKVLRWY